MLTIGRIVVVLQSGKELPAIVTEVAGTCCHVTLFSPNTSPQVVEDVPWFEARHQAEQWLGEQSAQNQRVAYLPYQPPEVIPAATPEQVAEAVQDIDAQIEEVANTLPEITGQAEIKLPGMLLRKPGGR